MPATAPAKKPGRIRQFVTRLEDGPGTLYERLNALAYRRTQLEPERVHMSDLARDAFAQYLDREEKKFGL